MKYPFNYINLCQSLDLCGELFEGEKWDKGAEIILKEIKNNENSYDIYLLAAETAESLSESKILQQRINLDLNKFRIRLMEAILQKAILEEKVTVGLQDNNKFEKIPYFLIATPLWENVIRNDGIVDWNFYQGVLLFEEEGLTKALKKKMTPVYRDYLQELGTPETLAIRELCRTLTIEFIQSMGKEKVLSEAKKLIPNVQPSNLEKLITFIRHTR